MRLHYYPEADSLYIELRSVASAETCQILDAFNVDFDGDGKIVGFDIDNASNNLDLSTLDTIALPVTRPKVA